MDASRNLPNRGALGGAHSTGGKLIALELLAEGEALLLVNLFGLAMRFGLTAGQIRDNVYSYPTFSSDIKHMLGHG